MPHTILIDREESLVNKLKLANCGKNNIRVTILPTPNKIISINDYNIFISFPNINMLCPKYVFDFFTKISKLS